MKFMISGAGGFVGKALCAELLRRGQSVSAAVRSGSSLIENTEVIIIGAIDGETNWADALRDVDVVIHLAARVHVMRESATDPLAEFLQVNLHGTSNLARQAACFGVKRLVYVSSIKVNGEQTSATQSFTELDEPSPQDFYSISKWQAEQALWRIARETGLEIVIVRPPLVYGAGVKGNFAQMLTVAAKHIPLPFASVHNRRSLIYVENLVDALIACATHPVAAGQTYLVCDGEDVSTPDLLHQLGGAMGFPARLLPFPLSWLRILGKLSGKSDQVERLLSSLQVDSGKIRRDLNWAPPYTLQQGLQATAESHRCLDKKS
ncbi:UDP-glucose 4-epimerase family protein [Candidatus Nitrotoga arctica]|uniref:UDP-glucose 4-epimerase n=1 Tax=Candidatus Nitrotoga arctica TaxID=453162 RepID=A0ABN8AMG2_9PROT|nr:SDR family oxidoreductase [Candidatus Nitrotoga arctica]CAG9934018.1 UDP-glucose 4-epimerase [Candidatus Nitrotoga arctica]